MPRVRSVPLFALLALSCAEPLTLDPAPEPALVREDDPVHLVGGAAPRGVYQVLAPSDTASADEEAISSLLAAPRRTLFLNRSGGTYTPGGNDSSRNVSSIVRATSQVPAYEKGDASWQSVVSCVRQQFAAFNVEVTDVDPGATPHIEAVFGGIARNIGVQDNAGGVAPMFRDCSIVERAVVFIFTRAFSSARVECEVAAQEIAHALGLDHEYLCEDPMTYLSGCGAKRFQDRDANCGEYSPRACMCGSTQNSVRTLLGKLGPASGTPTPPSDPGTPRDTTAPRVALLAPADGATPPANASLTVTAEATDDVGVARAELVWQFNGRTLPCDDSVSGVTCARSGNRLSWTFRVGTGSRTFEVRARDAAGNTGTSGPRTIQLADGGQQPPPPPPDPSTPPPPDPRDPVVTITAPGDGARIAAGQTFDLTASVQGEDVSRVDVLWQTQADSRMFAMTRLADGRWGIRIQLSAQAVPGPRQVTVTALTGGGRSASARLTLQVGG